LLQLPEAIVPEVADVAGESLIVQDGRVDDLLQLAAQLK